MGQRRGVRLGEDGDAKWGRYRSELNYRVDCGKLWYRYERHAIEHRARAGIVSRGARRRTHVRCRGEPSAGQP